MNRSANETPKEVDEKPSPPAKLATLDAERIGQIHRDSWDKVVTSLTGFVRDQDRAEDIASRAFQKAWEKRDQFRGDAAPSTWIQAIARNEARSAWRSEPIAAFDSLDKPDARQPPVAERILDGLEKQEDHRRLQTALECLPPKHRRALTDRYVDGLSTRQIAQREQIPEGTVLSRIFTAKHLLRHAWEKSLSLPKADAMERAFHAPQHEKNEGPPQTEGSRQEGQEVRKSITLDR